MSSRLGSSAVVAVDRRRRREDDASHARVARCEQDVERPGDVRGVAGQRIGHRPRNGRQRGLVEDDLAAGDRVVDTLVALDVALDELDVAVEGHDVRAPAGGEVVEDPDAMPERCEPCSEVGADEAAPSGDQDAHPGSIARAFGA